MYLYVGGVVVLIVLQCLVKLLTELELAQVFTLSFHFLNRGFFPGTGEANDIGIGEGLLMLHYFLFLFSMFRSSSKIHLLFLLVTFSITHDIVWDRKIPFVERSTSAEHKR